MKRKFAFGLALILVIIFAVMFINNNNAEAPSSPAAKKTAAKTETTQPATFNKNLYSTSDPASIWVVVNKATPLNPKSYAPKDLVVPSVAYAKGQYLRPDAALATKKMFEAAATEGLNLSIESAYRSYSTQVAVYNNEVASNGQTVADSQSARPGHSEHQTGLAADFGASSGKCRIADCFGNMPEGQWLAANAYKYGFILRYIPDKVEITGYRSEPWHFRYVGTALSTEMKKQNIKTLEEFFGLPAAPSYN